MLRYNPSQERYRYGRDQRFPRSVIVGDARVHPVTCVCDSDTRYDPTGTVAERSRGRLHLAASYTTLKKLVRDAVISKDVFGLGSARRSDAGLVFGIMSQSYDKVSLFQTMFADMLQRVVLDPSERLLRAICVDGYKAGLRHADSFGLKYTVDGSVQRVSVSQVTNLAHTELYGICDALVQAASRAVEMELAGGSIPVNMYHRIVKIIDNVGVHRSNSMVNSLVVKGHAYGTLDAFEAAGVEMVDGIPEYIPSTVVQDAPRKKGPGARGGVSKRTVQRIERVARRLEKEFGKNGRVNVITAGDDDVCVVCEEIAEEGPYTLNKARTLIPAHPNCRCAFKPARIRLRHTDAFNPNQPRDPEGTTTGGRWTKGGPTYPAKALGTRDFPRANRDEGERHKSVAEFIGDDPYNNSLSINAKMRADGDLTELEAQRASDVLSEILNKGTLISGKTFYRGSDQDYYNKRVNTEKAFLSLTSDIDVAEEFATATSMSGKGVVYRIKVDINSGMLGLDTSKYQMAGMQYQKETLVRPGVELVRQGGKPQTIGDITYVNLTLRRKR